MATCEGTGGEALSPRTNYNLHLGYVAVERGSELSLCVKNFIHSASRTMCAFLCVHFMS